MSEFLDELQAVAAAVHSDSGAVSVRQTGFGSPIVEVHAHMLAQHDEHSLADEIEQAVIAAREANIERLCETVERHGRGATGNNVFARYLPELASDIEAREGQGLSRRGHVDARAYGNGDVLIQFRNNAVRRTDIDNTLLEPEVNDAIARAMEALSNEIRELFRRCVAQGTRSGELVDRNRGV